jgi:hypothetical protein
MRTYTIAPASPISLKAAASVYVGAFGTIWLFVEPLGLFGLVPPVGGVAGLVSYLLMLSVAMFLLLAFLRGYQWYKTHDLPFVSFKVISASDGATYALRVAENMQVGDFLHDFLRLLSRGPGSEKVKLFSHHYIPILQVCHSGQFLDVDSNVTIGSAGLKDNDICQVRGKLSEVFNCIMFSRGAVGNEPTDP